MSFRFENLDSIKTIAFFSTFLAHAFYAGLIKTFKKPEKKFLTKFQIQLILSNCYFGIHRFYIGRNDIFKARISLIKAILLYPRCRIKEKLYLLIFPKKF